MLVTEVLEALGYEKPTPVQEMGVPLVESGKSVVVSAPTGSGKTVVGYAGLVKAVKEGKKGVYLVPLRALATEHYKRFKKAFPYKTALSIGDYDSADPWLQRYDVVFSTYEKFDSLIRHRSPFLRDLGVLVVDEIHLLDSDRGPTLEVLLTRYLNSPVQVIALSATIPNAREIGDWIGAEVVAHDWRPVKLREGVYEDGKVVFTDGVEEIPGGLEGIVEDTLKRGKQVLVFANTRNSAESYAEKLVKITERFMRGNRKLAEKVLEALEDPTEQCKKLAKLVERGCAFHHAGLVNEQREVVEEGFRKGRIRVVVATPTLAAGVNLPAFRVIVTSLYRPSPWGMVPISVREYKQMAGRAGRPGYDQWGECIIMDPKGWERYVLGDPEPVASYLSYLPALRTHLLALVVEGAIRSWEELEGFMERTFFAHVYGDVTEVVRRGEEVISLLESWGFLRDFRPTALGIRTSQLYLDPLSAKVMVERMDLLDETSFLVTLSLCTELPPLSVGKKEEPELLEDMYAHGEDVDLGRYKNAVLLRDWVNEVREEEIREKYGVAPGLLRARVGIAEWLAYSFSEIARVLEKDAGVKYGERMRRRIRHGVREELLPLVELKGIGRVRARKLYAAGIKSVGDVKRAPVEKLARILGGKLAAKIKRALGQEVEEVKVGQTSIEEFVGDEV